MPASGHPATDRRR